MPGEVEAQQLKAETVLKQLQFLSEQNFTYCETHIFRTSNLKQKKVHQFSRTVCKSSVN